MIMLAFTVKGNAFLICTDSVSSAQFLYVAARARFLTESQFYIFQAVKQKGAATESTLHLLIKGADLYCKATDVCSMKSDHTTKADYWVTLWFKLNEFIFAIQTHHLLFCCDGARSVLSVLPVLSNPTLCYCWLSCKITNRSFQMSLKCSALLCLSPEKIFRLCDLQYHVLTVKLWNSSAQPATFPVFIPV